MVYTVEGNTSAGSTLVANGGCVAKKSYADNYARIAKIIRPKYKSGEAKKVAQMALNYVGYLEKASNTNLESFSGNAGYNNYTMFAPHAKNATGSGVFQNGVAWCAIFMEDMMIRALGAGRARQLLGDWSAYTPTVAQYLLNAGGKEVSAKDAKAGDIIFFKNSTRICHVGTVVNDTYTAPASNSYNKNNLVREIKTITKTKSASAALEKTVTLNAKMNTKHPLVLPVQKYLKKLGYYTKTVDGIFGPGTASAVNSYQKNKLGYRNLDGEITAKGKMWKSLLGLI